MQVWTTPPLPAIADAGRVFPEVEAAGYDGAFTYEAAHDAFLPLALAAGVTSTLRLGTGVAIAFSRNPMTLANLGYDLQDLSSGRFVLGLGSQIRPHIEKRYSMPWSEPAARMRELVEAIRAIWTAWDDGSRLSFRGRFYTHTLMTPMFNPGPSRFGHARIVLGGVGERMTAVAGEVADGLITHPFSTNASLESLTVPALARGAAAAGRQLRDVEVIVSCIVATGRDGAERDASIAAARSQLAFYASTPAYARVLECHGWEGVHPQLNALSKEGRWADMPALITDEVLESIAIVGPPDAVAAGVRAKAAAAGADGVAVEITPRLSPADWAGVVAAIKSA